jgi:predicted HTH transcriptional regulator
MYKAFSGEMKMIENDKRNKALLNELLQSNNETDCIEFKLNNDNPEMIGKLCSALANSATINQKNNAYVVWGINDETKSIEGTTFDINSKTKGNQVFLLWLKNLISPSLAVTFKEFFIDDKKIVILEIPAAHYSPITFKKQAYVRIGSGTPTLLEYPDLFQKLNNNLRSYSWETANAKTFQTADDVLSLLEYSEYFKLTRQNLPSNKQSILDYLESDKLISNDVDNYWNITNLGAILFASDLRKFDTSLTRKGIRLVAYNGDDKASEITKRIDGVKGYAMAFSGVIDYLKGILPENEHLEGVFRRNTLLYPEIALRETIANSLIHQDMTITGSGPFIELYRNRIVISNPGKSLIKVDRMIDSPPKSRNEALAALMRRMNMCEESGQGLDKTLISIEINQLPPPIFQEIDDFMKVILFAHKKFAHMTSEERIRACYQHSVLKNIKGEKMKNSSLCDRFGIEKKNAAQVSKVIAQTIKKGLVKVADPEHPRAGYEPFWA